MDFSSQFKQLHFVIRNAERILLVAHSRPDGDTIGATLAMRDHIRELGKAADIACYDPFPHYLSALLPDERFNFPDQLNLPSYDAVIGCDSVERGFERIVPQLEERQVTVILDHHPDITDTADIVVIDPQVSSTCELVYDYLMSCDAKIGVNIATYLMIGILGDTGNFQHSNTSAKVMDIASEILKKGAPINKIVDAVFSNKRISTLKLWGRAFEKSRINPKNGMIATVLTQKDMDECEATTEDIAQVSSILNTVPGTRFALVLSERNGDTIKGSLRSEAYKGIDVSAIAHQFGGGGHKLASGFEIKGRILETAEGWEVV